MASVPVVMQRVRRARRRADEPTSIGRYREYEAEYEAVFTALDDLAGESALDEVAEWALESTRRERRLPPPAEVRARAREACDQRGATVPEDSPLAG